MENQTQNQIVLNKNTESPLEQNEQTVIGDTTQVTDLPEQFSDTVTVTNEKNVKNTIIQNINEDGDKKIEIISDEIVAENSELYESLQNKFKTFKTDFMSMIDALQTEDKQITDSTMDKTSLSMLADYGTSSTDESSTDSDSDSDATDSSESSTDDSCPVISNTNDNGNFRSAIYPDDSDSSSSSSSSSDDEASYNSDSSDNESIKIISSNANEKKKSPIQRKNKKTELDLNDLPPIENLQISVPESVCVELGSVVSIVEEQVVIAALPNMPPLDIDTVLFLNKGEETLGLIFDVFGPVNNPMYTVRFNNKEDILNKNVKVGIQVYCAPTTEHTSYVLVSDLMKIKGSDASWKEDQEPPANLLEYSDDEEERRMRAKRKNKQNNDDATSNEPSSTKQLSEFEKRKNERNLYLNDRFNNKKKAYNQNTSVRPRGFDFASKWTDHRNRTNTGPQYHTPPPSSSAFRPRHWWGDGSPGPSRFVNPVCQPQMYPMPYHPYFGNNTPPYGPASIPFPSTASSNITTPRPDFNLFCAPFHFPQSQILAPPPPPPPPKQNNNTTSET
ncbi:H/ACA ribonucleoprotein complex non-core subunit NAF1 [Chrysoperla carnea]|uniref:H/ACA ribonucleoprotein complex non-core subunit NAF1 n=1 Tax=Chrysoperla carnea TaxID=189513 RepID=UPI001D08390B|nr:H/ACA ribonucleoprotein complex non-core subunit NAF1 [Chrysoperla carnea]